VETGIEPVAAVVDLDKKPRGDGIHLVEHLLDLLA
jgi:hypothetical protein